MNTDTKTKPADDGSSVVTQFENLVKSYAKLFALCHEALGPGKTQAQRNEVREAIKDYTYAD